MSIDLKFNESVGAGAIVRLGSAGIGGRNYGTKDRIVGSGKQIKGAVKQAVGKA